MTESINLKRKNSNSKTTLEKVLLGYQGLRFGHYAWQGALLPIINLLTNSSPRKNDPGFIGHLKTAVPKIQKLFEKDAKNIARGLYPATVLIPESPLKHFPRIPLLFLDAYRASRQKQSNQTKKFDQSVKPSLAELPDYYQRNFHFQDSGYLGDHSAELYEHQVEVLFSGSADAMRRLTIAPLKNHFKNSNGQGLHFLEIGCGTGRLTRFMALAFPKAKITAVDLSTFYLKASRERNASFEKVEFVQGAAENLNFKDQTFDAVFSCYLFHELPQAIRSEVVKEGLRLLKPNGIYSLADSLQQNDDPELNWALEQFPIDFHEPFYKNYVLNPMEQVLQRAGFKRIKTDLGFLTKVVSGLKGSADVTA